MAKAVPGPMCGSPDFDTDLCGCKCETSATYADMCLKNNCTCLQNFGCVYNAKGLIVGVDPYSMAMKPIYECNRFCKCSPNCINRVVQNGITLDLQIFQTHSKGLGIRSTCDIAKGQFVL